MEWILVLNNSLNPLSQAILQTVIYADIFDYPLSVSEIHRYLVGIKASRAEVQQALNNDSYLTCTGAYFTLPGREAITDIRKKREARSQNLLPLALKYGRVLGTLPFVRMVALTGSLAVSNVSKTADFDYMLVTAPGRVWTARALALAFNRFTGLFGHTLCPNLIVAETALEWPLHDLYSAHELFQMIPITGLDVYQKLMKANEWAREFLPNANPSSPAPEKRSLSPSWRLLRRARWLLLAVTERALRGKLGERFEQWEMNRKIARFSQQAGFGEETVFNAEVCQGNFHHHRKWTQEAFEEKSHSLAVAPGGEVLEKSITEDRDGSISMTQILLGQSYYLRFDSKLWDAMQPYPPLGTMYAASWLRQHGYEVALFDAMLAESEEEWAKSLEVHKPQYAIIYEDNFNYLSKMCLLRMREAAFTMIQMAKSRGCVVILCGADATDHYGEYLEKGADHCIIGEGEESLLELLNHLSVGNEANKIIGVASRSSPHATRRPDITDLDKLPFPAWDLVDVEKYRSIWLMRHGYFSMNMVTTRGCPYRCNWCAKPIWGQRYNSRSPENVVAEMKWLKDTFAPDHIWFADDILGLKPNWIEKFATLLHEADAVIPFKCLQRADLANEKTVSALAKAGCKTVWIGAESGSQKILDAMNKGDKVEDIYRAAELLRTSGIEVGFFLQFGYPGETWEDVQQTLKMVRDCAPDDLGISVSYPLPGTKFYERVKLEMGHKQNWTDSDDLAMLYRGPFPTEFYRILHGRVHYEFRARRALRQPSLRGLMNVPRNLAGLANSEIQLRRFIQ